MSTENEGHFYVGELTDGRFVAASSSSPYFCFRAASEEAVIKKAALALTFFGKSQGVGNAVKIKSVTQTVTTLRPTRRVSIDEAMRLQAA